MAEEYKENVIEWLNGQETATISISQRKLVNRIMQLAAQRDDITVLAVNGDGSICARIPVEFVKINPTRQLSEETKARLRQQAADINQSRITEGRVKPE